MTATVVLVEGESDAAAVRVLAAAAGRDLEAEGIAVVAIGGTKNMTRELAAGLAGGARVVGLYDCAEEPDVRRALERAGLGPAADRSAIEGLGFIACDADLEDELLRALGTDAVVALVEAEGEGGPLRTFQAQPAQRDRPLHDQLRRFMGTKSGRKIRYGHLLAAALTPDRIPDPLVRLLALL